MTPEHVCIKCSLTDPEPVMIALCKQDEDGYVSAVAVDLILREEALIVREAIAARGVDTAGLSVAPTHTPN